MTTINHSIFTGSAGADNNTLTGRGFARVVDGREYGFAQLRNPSIPNTRRVLEHPAETQRNWLGIIAMLTTSVIIYAGSLIHVGVR